MQTNYRPGQWYTLVVPGALIALSPEAPDDLVARIWERQQHSGDLAAVIDVLTDHAAGSFAAMLPFAAVVLEGPNARIAVRGDASVQVTGADGPEHFDGVNVTTWSERFVPGASRLAITADDVSEGTALPIAAGIVRAAQVTADVTPADIAPPEPALPAESALPDLALPRPVVPDPVVPDPVVPGPATPHPAGASPSSTDDPAQDDAAQVDVAPTDAAPSDAAPTDDAPVDDVASTDDAPLTDDATDDAAPTAFPAIPVALPVAPPIPDIPDIPAVPDQAPGAPRLSPAGAPQAPAVPVEDATAEDDAVDGATLIPDAAEESDLDVFDQLFGETIATPPAAPAAPVDGDHDGATISVAEARALRKNPPTAAPDAPTAVLPVVQGAAGRVRVSSGQVVTLDRTVIVGRRPRSTRASGADLPHLIAVESPQQDISRSHLEIRPEGDTVVVVDLHTTNGSTLLRPGADPLRLHPGEPTLVLSGDVVDLGDGVTVAFEDLP